MSLFFMPIHFRSLPEENDQETSIFINVKVSFKINCNFLQRLKQIIVFKSNSNQKSYFDTTSINRSLQAE